MHFYLSQLENYANLIWLTCMKSLQTRSLFTQNIHIKPGIFLWRIVKSTKYYYKSMSKLVCKWKEKGGSSQFRATFGYFLYCHQCFSWLSLLHYTNNDFNLLLLFFSFLIKRFMVKLFTCFVSLLFCECYPKCTPVGLIEQQSCKRSWVWSHGLTNTQES